MCFGCNADLKAPNSREIKDGYAYWYKKRWLGKNWRKVRLLLFEDSSFAWLSGSYLNGMIVLRDAPEMIAAGQFTANVPNRPEFPEGYNIRSALAIGNLSKPVVQWFVFSSEERMVEWMRAIISTLPPPPQPEEPVPDQPGLAPPAQGTVQQKPTSPAQEPRAPGQEPRAPAQGQRASAQEQRTSAQEQRAPAQVPRARAQAPTQPHPHPNTLDAPLQTYPQNDPRCQSYKTFFGVINATVSKLP